MAIDLNRLVRLYLCICLSEVTKSEMLILSKTHLWSYSNDLHNDMIMRV